jgi:hypothetical protein
MYSAQDCIWMLLKGFKANRILSLELNVSHGCVALLGKGIHCASALDLLEEVAIRARRE